MKANSQFFEYHSEPFRSALIVGMVFLAAALIPPLLLIRLMIAACAIGPLWWSLMQFRRRGRGVTITQAHLVIQSPFIGPRRQIDLTTIQEAIITRHDHLAVAYLELPKQSAPKENAGGQVALIDARPHDLGPKRRLVISGSIKNIHELYQALQECFEQLHTSSPYPADFVALWAKRRRTRNIILVILALMATPVYAIILFRFIWIFFP